MEDNRLSYAVNTLSSYGIAPVRMEYTSLSITRDNKSKAYRYTNSNVDLHVSYTWVYETSAGCLRSIYPSLGMRQLFGDVTMGQWRHNLPIELSDLVIH